MPDIELEPHQYRRKGEKRRPKVNFTFFELLSFSIGSTWATRKISPPDRDRNARLLQAAMLGAITYFTSGGG